MTTTSGIVHQSLRGMIVCIIAIACVSACETAEPSGDCAFVSQEHLAVPRDGRSKTMICNPPCAASPVRQGRLLGKRTRVATFGSSYRRETSLSASSWLMSKPTTQKIWMHSGQQLLRLVRRSICRVYVRAAIRSGINRRRQPSALLARRTDRLWSTTSRCPRTIRIAAGCV